MGSSSSSAAARTDGKNVLVVVMCETRAWKLTFDRFVSNVLDSLDADLALCVGDREQTNPLYERAKHVWRLAEPDDWGDAFDRTAGNSNWRVLLRTHPVLLGGVEDSNHQPVGSSAITLYFRQFLKESLEQAGLTDAYDWLVLTRSDFMWPVQHPDPGSLSGRHIYVLDGEQYGGVCDRHFVVPRRFIRRFLTVVEPMFTDPQSLKLRIERANAVQGWGRYFNAERLLALRLKELGLWRRIRYLPYVPFTVRESGGSTRWSEGVFDDAQGYYVKYPDEMERSQVSLRFVSNLSKWREFLSPIRGAPARRKLKSLYRERGLYERPFPRIRGMHMRAYRRTRWTANRLLRGVPGMPRLLDARLRRIERRALRNDAD